MRLGSVQILVVATTAALFAASCKPQTQDGSNSSLQDAVVSSDQANRAYQITAQTKSYLPYEYTPDGCYARASYMQMELAAAGIPSRVAYVRAPVDRAEIGRAHV